MVAATYIGGMYPLVGKPKYPNLWQGCVGAWAPCLGPTGLSVLDWSGRKNHGTLTGGPTWVPSQGRVALEFDGVNDYADLGDANLDGMNTITLSTWMKTSVKTNTYDFIGKDDGISRSYGLAQVVGSGVAYFYVFNASSFADAIGTTDLSDSAWHHLAGVYNGSELSVYVDGKRQNTPGSDPLTGSVRDTSLSVKLGWNRGGGAAYLPGSIDDIRIYNRGLSFNEIKQLAARRGVAYELAPVRRAGESAAAYRRRLQAAQMIGGGML